MSSCSGLRRVRRISGPCTALCRLQDVLAEHPCESHKRLFTVQAVLGRIIKRAWV